ncbi:N-acetylmuramoyl-L-alanine amidase [Schleiferilactobacillus perolens]|jgi:hypothetical protein|uniref:N-acetylmuramoyl-L-alanine amidase n=1 Tax=Schleiferilactobacillus perolens TaxID=100468 RepID=UPI0023530B90|nr:N-acetylmuramoyl-L-alanine amidase [Schleiferilactobacillus perolens]MCI2170701.1 N-acetylmuramoyl-L-alanine amidase [Schleiferilactobacillus perolens]
MVKYDYSYQLADNQGDSRVASNQYIIAHDTGNDNNQGPNSAQNEAAYMRNNWTAAYTQAIAGHDRVYIVGSPGYVAYGAGSPANERSPYQIELAHYTDPALARAAYGNYINSIRDYAAKYGIPLVLDGPGNGIKSHKWVSDNLWGDHQDPYGYLARIGISKAQFAADLANGIGASNKPVDNTGGAKQVDFNAFNGSRPLDGSIGILWVTNPGGAVVYSKPGTGNKAKDYKQQASGWLVTRVEGNYYQIATNQWLAASDIVARIYADNWTGATVVLTRDLYPTPTPQSHVGLGSKPLPKGSQWLVGEYKDGHINIGGWVSTKDVQVI